MNALVISRIDCCNSLLNGLSLAVSEKLQCVQNASCRFDRNETMSHPCSWRCTGFLLRVALHSRPYVSPLNASKVLQLHIYQHFSFPNARHAVYALLISYFLNSPLPKLKSANDPSSVQHQGHGTNYSLQCANVRVLTNKVELKTYLFTDYYVGNRRL